MKKLLLSMGMLLTVGSVFADSYGTSTVNSYHVDSAGYAYFGTIVALPSTCSIYGDQFRFDTATPGGKNMLATLMAAKVAGIALRIWYSESPTPGANQNNGCTEQTLSIPVSLGL